MTPSAHRAPGGRDFYKTLLLVLSSAVLIWGGVSTFMDLWSWGALGWVVILLGVWAACLYHLLATPEYERYRGRLLAGIVLATVSAAAAGFFIRPGFDSHPDSLRKPVGRSDCPGVGSLPSDPSYLEHLSCAPTNVAGYAWDFDNGREWARIYSGRDEEWLAKADVYADSTTLRPVAGVLMYLSDDRLASYLDCA